MKRDKHARVLPGNRGAFCWLIPLRPSRWLNDDETIKEALARSPNVTRIIDHGTHLKVSVRRGKPPVLPHGSRRVRDRTTHELDGVLWDFVLAAYKRCLRKEYDEEEAANVLIHYIWNLFLVGPLADSYDGEEEWLAGLALRRARNAAKMTDEKAHGWELAILTKLPKKRRKR